MSSGTDNKFIVVTMPDGSKYRVPLILIARNHAEYYSSRDDVPFADALNNAMDLFSAEHFEAIDWAQNCMNWEDVEKFAVRIEKPTEVDYQQGWMNGEMKVVDKDEL